PIAGPLNSSVAGTSRTVAVSPAPPDHLAFTTPSASAATGVAVSPAIEVQVVDRFGNVLSDDNTDQVTLTVAAGPSSFAPGSTTTAIVSSGVATFSNVGLPGAGAYTLGASSTGNLSGSGFTVHVPRIG